MSFFLLTGFIYTSLLLTFPFLTTPLSMGCCLLLLTIMMAVTGGHMHIHIWLSYTLVLVFLGGLLVIFIYVALVASNEQFSFTLNPVLLSLLGIPLFIMWNYQAQSSLENSRYTLINFEKLEWLNKIYSEEYYLMTLFLILYLFLTLIVVVNNTKSTNMTLRSF